MKLTVIIPTFRRVTDLTRCLGALETQERLPDEVIVTVRDIDAETQAFLSEFRTDKFPLRSVMVGVTGVIAAMQAGIDCATGDIIALIDDDTSPFPDWLARIERWFAEGSDPKLAGVGGRDWQPLERGDRAVVGKLQWFGRVIGNHHLGAGPAREVDFLKGANCAYRAAPLKKIGFDHRLWGKGAQVNWELSLGLALRRGGWKLIYDPAVALDHHIGVRADNDTVHRGIYAFEGHLNSIHNETLVLLEHFSPAQRVAFFTWAFLVGPVGEPGLVQIVRLLLRRDPTTFPRFRAMREGRMAGLRSFRAQARRADKRPV